MLRRVELSSAPDDEFLLGLLVLLLNPLRILSSELCKVLHDLDGTLLLCFVVLLGQGGTPALLVEVEQHLLLLLVLLAVDADAVVVVVVVVAVGVTAHRRHQQSGKRGSSGNSRNTTLKQL